MTVPSEQTSGRLASIAGLIVALGSPFVLPYLPGQAHPSIADARQDCGIVVFEWTVALAVLAIVVLWERLPLRSIGFRRPSWTDLGALGITSIAIFVIAGIFSAATGATNDSTPVQIAAVPLGLRIAIFLTAGFCEELMFRAYAIERLTRFTGRLWVSGAIGVALFTLAHVPRYGLQPSLGGVAIIGAGLTALYLWRRNFWVCAAAHAFIDFVGLIVGPMAVAHAR
jgi:membrane protease YdiL (CAAX protease family)